MWVLWVLFKSLGSVNIFSQRSLLWNKISKDTQTWPQSDPAIEWALRGADRDSTLTLPAKPSNMSHGSKRLHTYRETDARFHTPLQSASHTDSKIHLSPGRPRLQGLNEIKGSICAAGVFSYALLTSWPWHRLLSGACRMRSHYEECAACVTLTHELLLQWGHHNTVDPAY